MTFNAYKSAREYVTRILGSVNGVKSLILDTETAGIIGVCYSQSDALAHSVLLTEQLNIIAPRLSDDLQAQTFPYLTALVLIQPTSTSIRHLCNLVSSNRYTKYHIFFTNLCPRADLDKIAKADIHDYIVGIWEYFLDYFAITSSFFHLNNSLTAAGLRLLPSSTTGATDASGIPMKDKLSARFDRDLSGLLALCCGLQKLPDIRYSAQSDLARTLALSLSDALENEAELLPPSHSSDSCLLIIMDRRDDAVTPLISQWTYQAMVHELIGIDNNRVTLQNAARPELAQLVLSPSTDDFFAKNMFCNFGEMGLKIKRFVSDYQAKASKANIKLDTIEDIQAFVDAFPEFRALSGNVSKHVALMTELSRVVSARRLMKVSALEQEIVCGNSSVHDDELVPKVDELLNDVNIIWEDKLRVVCLYALRYSQHERTQLLPFLGSLREQALDDTERLQAQLVDKLLEECGERARKSDLFSDSAFKGFIKFMKSELKGIDNIYTQHKPLLHLVITKLLSGDLSLRDYPFVDASQAKTRYKQIIVFYIGGITYEEYTSVETILHMKENVPSNNLNAPNASQSQQQREPVSPNPSGKGGKASVRGVFGAVNSVVNLAADAAKSAGVVLPKTNFHDFKIIVGGSCIHNSTSFMNDIFPVKRNESDFEKKINAMNVRVAAKTGITVPPTTNPPPSNSTSSNSSLSNNPQRSNLNTTTSTTTNSSNQSSIRR
jgi:vacuolar protein sorting-associated protein 45